MVIMVMVVGKNDLEGDWLVLGLVVPSFGFRCSCNIKVDQSDVDDDKDVNVDWNDCDGIAGYLGQRPSNKGVEEGLKILHWHTKQKEFVSGTFVSMEIEKNSRTYTKQYKNVSRNSSTERGIWLLSLD